MSLATVPTESLFFAGWSAIGRVAVMALAIYIVVVAILRVVGQRALAKMSAYDLIVTVTLCSLVASIPLQKSLSLTEGLTAIVTFLALQQLTSRILRRWPGSRPVVKSHPTLIVWDGKMLLDRMHEVTITPDEVEAAIRSAGMGSVTQAAAVVLENDGNWSVISADNAGDVSALDNLHPPGPLKQVSESRSQRGSRTSLDL
jgi:uncharacterized membrane protein YcaP (DUF421 family)